MAGLHTGPLKLCAKAWGPSTQPPRIYSTPYILYGWVPVARWQRPRNPGEVQQTASKTDRALDLKMINPVHGHSYLPHVQQAGTCSQLYVFVHCSFLSRGNLESEGCDDRSHLTIVLCHARRRGKDKGCSIGLSTFRWGCSIEQQHGNFTGLRLSNCCGCACSLGPLQINCWCQRSPSSFCG